MDTYALNPNPIPQVPMTSEQNHRMLNLFIIVVAAAAIVGLLYWWSASTGTNVSPSATSGSIDARTQIAAALRNAPVHASQQEIDGIAAQLKGSPVTATDAQKQAVANQLRQASSQEI